MDTESTNIPSTNMRVTDIAKTVSRAVGRDSRKFVITESLALWSGRGQFYFCIWVTGLCCWQI